MHWHQMNFLMHLQRIKHIQLTHASTIIGHYHKDVLILIKKYKWNIILIKILNKITLCLNKYKILWCLVIHNTKCLECTKYISQTRCIQCFLCNYNYIQTIWKCFFVKLTSKKKYWKSDIYFSETPIIKKNLYLTCYNLLSWVKC